MNIGTVTFYNAEKGYGFIRNDAGGQDNFVHATGLIDTPDLAKGDRVSFSVEWDDRKGKEKAVNVRLIA